MSSRFPILPSFLPPSSHDLLCLLMEKEMDWERNRLVIELTEGKELSDLLRKHLHPSSSPETRGALLEKILCSYDKALSMLNWSGFTVEETKPDVLGGSSAFIAYSSPGSDASVKKDVFKKRKTCSGWGEPTRVCSGTSVEGPLDDGYCWRKYGQKDILGSNFPRGYYRCTHRYSQGCLAAKQVQRSDDEPTIFEVKYRGRHTCNRAPQIVPKPVPRTIESNEKQTQSKEAFSSFETGLKLKTEELDNGENMFPSFTFPTESDGVGNENGLFFKSLMENDIMGNLSPAFAPPAMSQSNYFSSSAFNMGKFGLGQNVQSSESGLTEIISAPTSVSNSPIVDLDISSLEELESFSFDNLEFFS